MSGRNRTALCKTLLIIILLITAGGLRFIDLGHKCFWPDEMFSYEVCLGLRYDDSTPMLFYSMAKPFLRLPFSLETNGRILSALFGVLTVLVIMQIARCLIPFKFAYSAGLLAALNPVLIQASQEFRAYSMMNFLLALVILAAFNIIRIYDTNSINGLKQTGKWYVLFIASSVIGLYTHYIFIPFLVVMALLFFFSYLRKIIDGKALRYSIISFSVIFLLFIPNLSFLYHRMAIRNTDLAANIRSFDSIKFLIKTPWGFNAGYMFKNHWLDSIFKAFNDPLYLIVLITSTLLVFIFIWGFFKCLRAKPYLQMIALSYILFFSVFLIVEFSDFRQLTPILIPYLLITAFGLSTLDRWKRYAGTVIAAGCFAGALIWYYSLPYPPHFQADFRRVADYLDNSVQDDEPVLAIVSGVAFLNLERYCNKPVIPANEYMKRYHTSADYLKPTMKDLEDVREKDLSKLKELLSQNETLVIIILPIYKNLLNFIGGYTELSSVNFGPDLEILKIQALN